MKAKVCRKRVTEGKEDDDVKEGGKTRSARTRDLTKEKLATAVKAREKG